jgi:anti-sigma factor RsiW
MKSCNEHGVNTLRYLDNELSAEELEDFFAHLTVCTHCRARLEQEQDLSRLFNRSRPLYSAPVELSARVSALLQQSPPNRSPGLYTRVFQILIGPLRDTAQRVSRWKLLMPAVPAIVICLLFLPDAVQQARAVSYVETAVATHRSFLNGNLPSEIQSESPEVVTAWIAGKVPFHFQLPARLDTDSKPAYRLTGARLVSHKGSQAASITYDSGLDKVSLLVASSEYAVVAGGDEARSGSLTFHYRSYNGFRVVTWSAHGISYALVSPLSVSARQACMACHQDMANRKAF